MTGLRWLGLIVLSALLTAGLEALHLPAALLLGPMAAGVLVAISGHGVRLPDAAMHFAQGLVGLMIAAMLPAQMLAEVAARWPIVVLGTLSTLIASAGLGWVLSRSGLLPGTTAIWGSAPGAASAMTLISGDYGADMRLVAVMQYTRVACVALAATLVAHGFGASTEAPEVIWFPAIPLPQLGLTLALAAGLAFLGLRLRLPGGSFLLPMLVGLVVVHQGAGFALPPWLLALSYACIGWNIGLRFTPALLSHALRVLPRVIAAILALIAICGGLAWALVVFAGIDPLTAYLATSPGGADSVAIISASTAVDVPFVMTMQMSRFLLILVTGPVLARWLSGPRRQAPKA